MESNTPKGRFWTPGDTEMPGYTVSEFRYHARAYFGAGLLLGAVLMACIWWLS